MPGRLPRNRIDRKGGGLSGLAGPSNEHLVPQHDARGTSSPARPSMRWGSVVGAGRAWSDKSAGGQQQRRRNDAESPHHTYLYIYRKSEREREGEREKRREEKRREERERERETRRGGGEGERDTHTHRQTDRQAGRQTDRDSEGGWGKITRPSTMQRVLTTFHRVSTRPVHDARVPCARTHAHTISAPHTRNQHALRAHARTRTHKHTRARTRTQTHTHTGTCTNRMHACVILQARSSAALHMQMLTPFPLCL